MRSVENRLRALERMEDPECQPQTEMARGIARGDKIFIAIAIYHTLREGGEAKKELDAAGASLNPERRAELTEQLDAARKIAALLEKHRPAQDTPLSARLALLERSGGPPGASQPGGCIPLPDPVMPLADQSLPPHPTE